MSTAARRILYCHCAFAQVVPAETKAAVLERLSDAGVPFEAVPDLCELTARRDPAAVDIAASGATIVACYPRAVRWMFNAAGSPLPEGAEVLNMRVTTADEIVSTLNLDASEVSR